MNMKKRAVALLLCAAMMTGAGCNKDSKKDAPNSSGLNSDTPVSNGQDTSSPRNNSLSDGGTVIQESDPFFDIVDMELELPGSEGKTIASLDIDRDSIRFVGNMISVTQCSVEYVVPKDVREKMKLLESNGESDELEKLRSEYSMHFNALFDLNGKLLRYTQSVFQENILTSFEGPNGESYAIADDNNQTYLKKIQPDGSLETVRSINAGFVDHALMMPDGTLVCASAEGVTVFDAQGNQKGLIQEEGFSGELYSQGGKCYGRFFSYDFSSFEIKEDCLKEIDTQNCRFVGDKIPVATSGMLINSADGIYVISQNGLKKLNLTDSKKSEEMFSWSDTDYDPTSVLRRVKVVSDCEFCFFALKEEVASDGSYNVRPHILHAVRAAKNPYAGRTRLCVGEFLDAINRELVIRYNTDPSSTCRIILYDYSVDVGSGGSMNNEADLSDRVYLDIISGDGPDMLAGFSRYAQFNSDKVLLDLNPLIDATDGTGLDRNQYFDNIIRAQEVGGKLYQLPVEFELYGLLGNKKLVGDAKPRSYDEFMKEMDALPSDASVMYQTDDKEFLQMFIGECGENFIDYSEQTVNFDSDEFKKVLEIVKKYGIRNLNRMEDYRDDMTLFMDDKLAWYSMYMYCLRDYGSYLARFGDNVTFSGFPGNNGNGVVANVDTSIGISAYSKNSKEAWEFIRYILANTVTDDLNGALRIPLSRSGLDQLNQALIADSEEKLKTWNQDPYPGMQHPDKLTPEMAEAFVSIVESVTTARKTDPAVLLIIYEEAPAYLLGQKSVDDVADIIQNRCKIIVQERG